jgi:hypothetical protein
VGTRVCLTPAISDLVNARHGQPGRLGEFLARDALRFDVEQKAYSESTGQGSDDDLGPRSVLPPKNQVVGITTAPSTRVPDPEGGAMLDHISKITHAELADFTPIVEAQLRQELRNYAVELRQLAYTLPDGVGEYGLLRLSGRMRAAADQVVAKGT